jgi:hypothetical protein
MLQHFPNAGAFNEAGGFKLSVQKGIPLHSDRAIFLSPDEIEPQNSEQKCSIRDVFPVVGSVWCRRDSCQNSPAQKPLKLLPHAGAADEQYRAIIAQFHEVRTAKQIVMLIGGKSGFAIRQDIDFNSLSSDGPNK